MCHTSTTALATMRGPAAIRSLTLLLSIEAAEHLPDAEKQAVFQPRQRTSATLPARAVQERSRITCLMTDMPIAAARGMEMASAGPSTVLSPTSHTNTTAPATMRGQEAILSL